MRSKFSFMYVGICFDVTKCKFIVKNSRLKMLVVFLPIFVVYTKITFIYNFVAPLMGCQKSSSKVGQQLKYLPKKLSKKDLAD